MPKQASKVEIEELFRKRAQEVLKKDISSLSVDKKFGELEVPSVDVMEIIGAMEDDLDVELPDSDLARVESPKDLIQLFLDQQL